MIGTRTLRPATGGALALGLYLLAALVVTMVLAARPAHADTTFTVNSTANTPDTNLSDARCDVNPNLSGDSCTLRAAIEEANDTPGADTINFNIVTVGGSVVKTIQPLAPLPGIRDMVTIDGYTQPGASPNTLARGTNAVLRVELKGSNNFISSGLFFSFDPSKGTSSSGSVVKGLVINRFQSSGISMGDVSGIRVEGNFIGTDPSGETRIGNNTGVSLFGENTLGGPSPASRNLISGNQSGVTLGSAGKVQGNLIGTDKDGTDDLGNGGSGVRVIGQSGTIGGTDIDPNDANNPANTIAFNGSAGVSVADSDFTDPAGNRILSNSIFSNAGLGIDLGEDGITINDAGDADSGPNDLQNKPVLTSAATSSSATTVRGTLNSTPGTTFKIQFFSNPSGNEGKRFIGQKNVTTGPDGLATFAFSPARRVAAGQTITATATDPEGNTSEFSAPEAVVAR